MTSVPPALPPAKRFGPTALATPANAVTAARLALGVPFLVFVAGEGASWAAITGWFLLGVSDYLDGWIARKEGTTRSGAYLDPLADKVVTVGGFMALSARGVYHWLPVALIVVREFGISVYRSWLGRRGVSVPARSLGKLKTALQLLAVGWALLPPTSDVDVLVQGFFAAALTLTLVSGIDLVRRGQRQAAAS